MTEDLKNQHWQSLTAGRAVLKAARDRYDTAVKAVNAARDEQEAASLDRQKAEDNMHQLLEHFIAARID